MKRSIIAYALLILVAIFAPAAGAFLFYGKYLYAVLCAVIAIVFTLLAEFYGREDQKYRELF